MSIPVSRRHLLGTGAAFGAAALIPVSLPVSLRAQGKTLVAATFPGTWNEAHREFLAPAFTKRTGASVTQSPKPTQRERSMRTRSECTTVSFGSGITCLRARAHCALDPLLRG